MSINFNLLINFFLHEIFIFTFFYAGNLFAKTNYFSEGQKLYNEKKLSKSKFKFEQDIVFNPKSEKSYLYLLDCTLQEPCEL